MPGWWARTEQEPRATLSPASHASVSFALGFIDAADPEQLKEMQQMQSQMADAQNPAELLKNLFNPDPEPAQKPEPNPKPPAIRSKKQKQ